mmetsp:Transcript_90259/g.260233  ORF Transcript_90259/g.260233 Transcript_90259/m.260233 type:complete len:194 (-) Transcript_90259:63-644(-)
MQRRPQTPTDGRSGGAQPARHRIRLAVTPMKSTFVPFMGYHSSVLIGSMEYSFSNLGVFRAPGPISHSGLESETTYIDCGRRFVDLAAFEKALFPHFAPGSYDLLRKNCNSFSDCALTFLTGVRLDAKYRQAEFIAELAERHMSLMRVFTRYEPNPEADDWDVDDVIDDLSELRSALKPVPVVVRGGVRPVRV